MPGRILIALIFVISASVHAQDLGIYEEVTAGNFFGFGARQMSMGGAGIANSIDGSALYYNPAALAKIPRIEFQFGFTHQKFSNQTSQRPGRYDPAAFIPTINSASNEMKKTKLGTINLTIPVPTYRGSLVVAFGVNRIISFNRNALYHVRDLHTVDNNIIDSYATEHSTGSIYLYSAAVGMDISPNLSLGGALHVYSGDNNSINEYRYYNQVADSLDSVILQFENGYIGATLKGGILYRPNQKISLGIAIETPLEWQVNQGEVYQDGTREIIEYDLTRPFVFGAGLSYRFDNLTMSGDAEYVDWTQLAYSDNPWMEADNDKISALYRRILNLRIGAEYQLPRRGLALRAGLFSQPLPYSGDYINSDRKGFTLGMGWLIDKVFLVEVAYMNGQLERTYSSPDWESTPDNDVVTAEDSFQRIYLTISYRN